MKTLIKRVIVALFLSKLNRSEKVKQGNGCHEAVTGSAFFPPAEKAPLLASLRTGTDNLSAADAETETGSHLSFAAADVAELQYDMSIRNMGAYVQQKADADPERAVEIIMSAGLKIKRASVKREAPRPVQSIRAIVTGNGNSIKLSIASDNPRSTFFEIVMSTTPDVEGSWVSIANITSRKFLVEHLQNGTRYYFKVRAINSIGRSIYSNVISQVAA